ncbi:HEPN domain-containing protein [candidate division KSB1 bacterium]|nr:HEPN domain-containing protein [candidate division KSB1 bacterium]
MELKKHIDYWLKSAAHYFESAETLYKHRRYDWCCFLGTWSLRKC